MNIKIQQRSDRRAKRIRAKLAENKDRARLSVFRSNNGFSAQIIDDNKGATLVSVTTSEVEDKKGLKKVDIAEKLGEIIASKAKEKKITDVRFDKGEYKYHGRVKAFAQGARNGGLNF